VGLFGRRRSIDPGSAVTDDSADGNDLSAAAASTDEANRESVAQDEPAYEPTTAFSRLRGPFDHSEVEGLGDYLDLGALWLPRLEGMQLQLEVDQQTQMIHGAQIVQGRSVVQLQAFAAPRTTGLWAELRGEIAQGVTSQGGSAEVVDGTLGKELRVVAPGGQVLRFFGVDGPRWFLRAVLNGPAATDDVAAASLVDIVRRVVVVRGSEAMPPREALALRLPEQPTVEPPDSPSDASEQRARPRNDDLRPFERGPEITEVH
jgi:hypothetical protein